MAMNNPDDNNRVLEPPSSLHTKLQRILIEFDNTESEPDKDFIKFNEAIAQILQALQEEGYIKPEGEIGQLYGVEIASINGDSNIMTGQDFYDRFIHEYKKTFSYTTEFAHGTDAIEAARRAAGVSDE